MAAPTARQKRGLRWKTLVALAFGHFVDQGEGQALSVLFPTIRDLWNLSYTSLGSINTIRLVLQSVSAPFWGYIADRFSRKSVIVFGTGVWGVWTLVCGLTQSFGQLLAVRAISGLGLGCLMPATFSLIADTFPPRQRGRALGGLEAIGVIGIVLSTVGLGMLATPTLWRWGFVVLGGFSVLSGVVVWLLVDEPPRGAAEPELEGKITHDLAEQYTIKLSDLPQVASIPTVWVAILQGLAGTMPWVVLQFYFIAWLVDMRGMVEQLDFNHPQGSATLAFAAIVVGTAISNILGGVIGDWAEQISPRYGRTVIGQISIFSGIPTTYVLLTQTESWPFWAVFLLCFGTAVMIGWPGKGAKLPMMQGAVPPELRSSAFALMTFVEKGFSALVALAAGWLADRIGFTRAMVWTVPVPWIVCLVLYSGFYWSYPRDSVRMREMMAERARTLGS